MNSVREKKLGVMIRLTKLGRMLGHDRGFPGDTSTMGYCNCWLVTYTGADRRLQFSANIDHSRH